MKKRVLSLLLAMCMMLSLTACGGNTAAPAASGQNDASKEQENVSSMSTVVVDGLELGFGLMMEEEAIAELDANPDRDIDRAVEPIKPVPDAKLDGTLLTNDFYYYRDTLDTTMQQAYDLIRNGLLEGQQQIRMTVPVQKENIFNLYKMVLFDSPELFWAEVNGARYAYNNNGHVTVLAPGYNDLVKDIKGNTAKLEAAVSDALADMWSLSTDAEKAKYAHDWLTHQNTYDANAPYNQTSYSALVNHSSVCAGYAHAFQYMMQQMGIPCAYVLGYALGGFHAWNVVKLDGEHYAMDVTWDDPLGSDPGKYYYTYFNVTDQKLGSDHVRSDVCGVIPVAAGTACNYQNAFGGNAYGTNFDAIVGVLPEKVTSGEGTTSGAEGNPYLS